MSRPSILHCICCGKASDRASGASIICSIVQGAKQFKSSFYEARGNYQDGED